MSDDLVKRLREDQPVTQDMGSTMQCDLQDAAADRIEELEAKLAKAVKLIDLAVELAKWDLNPKLRDDMIDFTTELKGQADD
jgi:hypothetical protein